MCSDLDTRIFILFPMTSGIAIIHTPMVSLFKTLLCILYFVFLRYGASVCTSMVYYWAVDCDCVYPHFNPFRLTTGLFFSES